MPDGVDPVMDAVEAAGLHPASDHAPGDARGVELGEGDDTVLAPRDARNDLIRMRRGA
jgi:hypothetical protein